MSYMTLRMKAFLIILSMVLGSFLFYSPTIYAQKLTHVVEKGDTLWDICEKYYGDADLWPKLWQMNPFVTNPHLLTPGEIITLFDKEVLAPIKVKKEEAIPVKKIEEPKPSPTDIGVNVNGITNIRAIGYLSLEKPKPWGTLFATDRPKIMWVKGDTVFAIFDKDRTINVGDEFAICQMSTLLRHPLTDKELGYIFSIYGRLKIEQQTGMTRIKGKEYRKENVFQAKILETYTRSIRADDVIMPYQAVSSCVKPVSINQEFTGNIVAVKEQLRLVGQHSVVYIDQGTNQGIHRGNLFEVIKENVVANPDRKDKSKELVLPDIPIATIMILESRADTSTGVVLSAIEDFFPGASIRAFIWQDEPKVLSYLPECPIK